MTKLAIYILSGQDLEWPNKQCTHSSEVDGGIGDTGYVCRMDGCDQDMSGGSMGKIREVSGR